MSIVKLLHNSIILGSLSRHLPTAQIILSKQYGRKFDSLFGGNDIIQYDNNSLVVSVSASDQASCPRWDFISASSNVFNRKECCQSTWTVDEYSDGWKSDSDVALDRDVGSHSDCGPDYEHICKCRRWSGSACAEASNGKEFIVEMHGTTLF